MPSERRFRYDGAKATRFYQPNDGDDRMNENDEDVVHAGIVSNLKKPLNSGRFCNSHRQTNSQDSSFFPYVLLSIASAYEAIRDLMDSNDSSGLSGFSTLALFEAAEVQ